MPLYSSVLHCVLFLSGLIFYVACNSLWIVFLFQITLSVAQSQVRSPSPSSKPRYKSYAFTQAAYVKTPEQKRKKLVTQVSLLEVYHMSLYSVCSVKLSKSSFGQEKNSGSLPKVSKTHAPYHSHGMKENMIQTNMPPSSIALWSTSDPHLLIVGTFGSGQGSA